MPLPYRSVLDAPTIRRVRVTPDRPDQLPQRAPGTRRPHGEAQVAAVRYLIEQTELTYGEIARKTGVGRASICRWTVDNKWVRPVFAPRATDRIPRARASAKLRRRTLAARLDALAQRYVTELEFDPGVDLDKLAAALELAKMAKLAAIAEAAAHSRPRTARSRSPGEANRNRDRSSPRTLPRPSPRSSLPRSSPRKSAKRDILRLCKTGTRGQHRSQWLTPSPACAPRASTSTARRNPRCWTSSTATARRRTTALSTRAGRSHGAGGSIGDGIRRTAPFPPHPEEARSAVSKDRRPPIRDVVRMNQSDIRGDDTGQNPGLRGGPSGLRCLRAAVPAGMRPEEERWTRSRFSFRPARSS